VLSAHTRKTTSRVTVALRLAAVTVGRSNTALGAFYRRLAGRIGNARPLPRRRARSLSCSTTRCGMVLTTVILEPTTTNSNTATGSSSSFVGALHSLATHCSYRNERFRSQFLRKAAAYFAKMSG
jgi:hypothetical protein